MGEVKELITSNEDLMGCKNYRDLMNQYIISYNDRQLAVDPKAPKIKSMQEFLNIAYASVSSQYKEDWQVDYIKTRLIYEHAERKGTNGLEGMIKDFQSTVKEPRYVEAVNRAVNKWKALEVGAQAPDIVGTDMDGNEVKLSDFKGKIVYVDVWATWCGPCKREIPNLKQAEKTLHGKDVVFLSVSTDKDRGKWEKFVKDQELTGVQIHQPGGWGADICRTYNISGIPRFMLIDKEGKIISTDAPRPSQGIVAVLQKELRKEQ